MTLEAAPDSGNSRPTAWTLAAIVAAGVAARLLVLAAIPTRPVSDFLGYFVDAESLARTGRYEAAPGVPVSSHPPAYSLVLAAAMRAAPSADPLSAAKAANTDLAALTIVLAALLARRLWGNASGLWAAAWLAFLPRSLLTTDLIASENLFSPLLLLFLLLCADSWIRESSLAHAAAIGATAGLLCLTRSVAYLVPLVWLAGELAARRPRRRLLAELLVVVAVEHAVLLPWALRNARAVGRFTFLGTESGAGLFIANNPAADGAWHPWAADIDRLRPGIHARGQLAVDDAAREEAWRWIRAHPGRAASLYLRRLRLIATDDSTAAEFAIFGEGTSPPDIPGPVLPGPHPLKTHADLVRRVLRATGVLLAVAALGGFTLLVRKALDGSAKDRALAAGFAAAVLYLFVFSAVVAVNGRYRWPVEDAVAPLAGLFLNAIPRLARLSPMSSARTAS